MLLPEIALLLLFLTSQYYRCKLQYLLYLSPLILILLNVIQIAFDDFDHYSFITFVLPIPLYSYDYKIHFQKLYFLSIKMTHLCLLMVFCSVREFNYGQPIVLFVIVAPFVILQHNHSCPTNDSSLVELSHTKTLLDNERSCDPTCGLVGILKLNEDLKIVFQNEKARLLVNNSFLNSQIQFVDKVTKAALQMNQDSVLKFQDILVQVRHNLLIPHRMEIYLLKDYEQLYFQVFTTNTEHLIVVQELGDYVSFIKKKHTQTTMKQLFRTFSHELNTSLNYILALAQVAQCHDLVTKIVQEKYFLPIIHCCLIMHSLVSDIMDYNLILSKQFNLEVSTFHIPSLIDEVVDLFKYQVNQKKLQIQFRNNLLNYDMLSDRNRIKQILINLVSNAQKFTLSGSITIQVGAVINKKQLCVVFHVMDTGIGMNDEESQRLHNLLLSGVPQSTRISQNTVGFGLGLFISNKIAEVLSQARYDKGGGLRFETQHKQGFHAWFMARHQSIGPLLHYSNPTPIVRLTKKIQMDTMESQISRVNAQPMRQKFSRILGIKEIKSERGTHKGLTLKLRRPAVKIARELFEATVTSEKRIDIPDVVNEETNQNEYESRVKYFNQREPPQCTCPQILIADDEQTNIMALSMMLEQMGYRSDSVFNGAECVALIEKEGRKSILSIQLAKCLQCRHKNYRLIFMDINMPILDGIEATIQIKHSHEDIVIIACTAFTDTETRNMCYKSGMSYHLSKPVKKEQLKEILSYYFINQYI